jgi:hypothetical protein
MRLTRCDPRKHYASKYETVLSRWQMKQRCDAGRKLHLRYLRIHLLAIATLQECVAYIHV